MKIKHAQLFIVAHWQFTSYTFVTLIQWWIQDFPDGWGGAPTPEVVAKTYLIWQYFCRKLHEKERNWIEKRKGCVPPSAPLHPPIIMN